MKNILVIADPINENQLALNKAISLASRTVAKIHIVLFCYESLAFINTDAEKAEIKRMLLDRRKQTWESYLLKQDFNVTVTYEIVWEQYIEPWVREYCNSDLCDLIIKSGHRSETPFHTPTDWQLFRKSKVPVYCVGSSPKKSEKRVLVALDMATKHEEKKALNLRLLEAAFRLSLQTNSALYCCSAIKSPGFLKDIGLIDMSKQLEIIEKENVHKLFDDYDIDDDNLFVQQGDPWKVITDYAKEIKADCIVIGSMGRKGISGKLIGNTAEKVIHYTESDFLVISPE